MKKYILISTIIAVFSESLFFRFYIDFKIFYILVFINFIIFSFSNKFHFSKTISRVLLVLLLIGFYTILIGENTTVRLISQLVGIFFVSNYFYSFFNIIDVKIEKIFKFYSHTALVISIYGIIQSVILSIINNELIPVKGILLEPAHFAAIVLPSCYYFYKSSSNSHNNLFFLIVLIAIIFSFSSIGYLGVLFGVILLPNKLTFKRIITTAFFIFIIFSVLIQYVNQFEVRTKDTIDSISNQNLGGVNLSTYALLSNLYVAVNSFTNHPIIGSGIGSHLISHNKYIDSIEGVDSFSEEFVNLNAQDANSLFLRVLSETGLLGILLVFYFIVKNFSSENNIISKAILIYFFCKLFREGHYFSPELYFFVFAYYYNKLKTNNLNAIT